MIKKFCCISDTHGIHRGLDIEPCDFIIHSGDIFRKSKIEDILDFIDWFSSLPAVYKVLVAGNHDRFIDREKLNFLKLIEDKIFYLENSGIELEGIRFWGSPSVKWCAPYRHFAYSNEAEAEEIFSLIPENIDILITHGPPFGILDSENGWDGITHHGSKSLLKNVLSIKPKYHIFGHVHKDYGIFKNEHTVFINSCILNNNETIVNMHNTFYFDIEKGIVES
jgi:Icc-related predicted phosphoesterase